MATRFLDFPPDTPISSQRWKRIDYLEPGDARDKAIAQYELELGELSPELETRSTELRDYVLQFDPVQLISCIALLTSLGSTSTNHVPDDAGQTFTYNAKIEFLVGVVLSASPGSDNVTPQVAQETLRLTGRVFDAAWARIFLTTSREQNSNDQIDQAIFLLKMERLYDRMTGYVNHVQEIDTEIFEPNRAFYIEHLGFCPSDTSVLVRKTIRVLNEELDRIGSEFTSEGSDELAKSLIVLMNASHSWYPNVLSEITELPTSEIECLLNQLSVDFECQPEFLTPLDENQARTHPAIRLPDGGYLVANPWSVMSCIHPWIEQFIKSSGNTNFARRYETHRSRASQSLTAKTLERLFGHNSVHEQQHYDGSDGHGEVDCLVSGELPVIVEVKSHSLTETGRRGHQPRVERVITDVFSVSTDQIRRASEYIQRGGTQFAKKEGSEPLQVLPGKPMDPIEIVIIRERMDPLTMQAFGLPKRAAQRKVWMTSLVDLLMVAKVLDDPASFLHYAATRGRINQKGYQIYVEADALGAYVETRLKNFVEFSLTGDNDPDVVMLAENSAELNQYYTGSEAGDEVELPTSGVPYAILEALRSTCGGITRAWWATACDAMEADIARWRVWKRFVRKHEVGRKFALTDRSSLRVCDLETVSITTEGEQTVLNIPQALFDSGLQTSHS